MHRHSTKVRRQPRPSVLEVRVLSPRIVWLGCLQCAGTAVKVAVLLAVLAGIGWGGWRGIQRAFYHNPDFRLQIITLNDNPVIDELGVAAAVGIDLTASPCLLELKLNDISRKLRCLPEIADVKVERHLPGTLAVTVTPRLPQAWITHPVADMTKVRRAGAMLVDHDSVAYPCPQRQAEAAALLPVIIMPVAANYPITAGAKITCPALEHCLLLLESAREADPNAMQWIESVQQVNEWSLLLVTRQGTRATFGLGDNARQLISLRAALDHAADKGYLIETVNLIPKYNIPITLRDEPAAPPRAIPVVLPGAPAITADRRTRDSGKPLKHN